MGVGRHRVRQEKLEEGEIGRWPQLTGEADRRIRGADPAEHEGFALRGFGQLAAVADDAHAAGGAACATAAYAGMGYVVAESRLQNAQTLRHPGRSAVTVGKTDHAAAALVQRACASGQQDKSEQTEIADQE